MTSTYSWIIRETATGAPVGVVRATDPDDALTKASAAFDIPIGWISAHYGINPASAKHTPTLEEIDAAIERAKREVLEDIASGRVPDTVASFSELHDYVDANEYGGLCDAGPIDWLDPDEVDPLDSGNRVQNAVHAWIVGGRK